MGRAVLGGGSMRVALVCPYSLSRPGGVQGQVLGLARSLVRRGHAVRVLAPVDRDEDRPRGIDFVDSGHSTSVRANGSVAPVSLSPAAARRALEAVRAWEPDVIHIHEPFAPGLPYALLTARGLPPLVGTFHRSGGSMLYTVARPLVRRMADRLAVRCAVSEAAAATAASALGGEYDVLFNGIEVDRFVGVEPWSTTGPTVLFLGRHEARKGLAVLLDAWDLMVGAGPVVGGRAGTPELWVAGDGPETEALRRRHHGSESVRWLGVLGEEEKIRRLVGSDLLAAPSLGGESFGLVLLEAMAARTVVVASDIDGYRDAAGGCAVLVEAHDAAALAAGLRGVLTGSLAPPAHTGDGEGSGNGSVGDGERDSVGDRDDWLAAGAARADRWSMASLTVSYEAHYRDVVVGAGS